MPSSCCCLIIEYSRISLQRDGKVALLGASGGIGQPLALLLKQSPLVTHLSLYDIAHTPGEAQCVHSGVCAHAHTLT